MTKKVLTTSRLRLLRTFEASYKPEPWALSLLNCIKHRARKRGEALREMEAYHIEALAAFQGYRCVVSNTPFVLPTKVDLEANRGYSMWLRSLKAIDRARAPIPVRGESDGPWGPGNVLLLVECWAAVYEQAGGSVQFHDCIRDVAGRIRENNFVVMTAEEYPEALLRLAESKLG